MRKAGRLAAEILDMLVEHAQPGTTTEALDKLARDYAFANGSMPATLFYRGYRHSLCTSINHVVCHGIPGPKPLKNGDIVNIDVTVVVDGWHGDTSRMYMIGEPRRKAELLVDTTYEAMMAGINAIKPGVTLGTIGAIIQEYAEERRCSIVRDFCGHGLGQLFHDSPNVLHFGTRGEGVELKEGMLFTVEPMLNLGRPDVKVLSDGWTAVTRDKSLSAQFEHSVGVTADGVEIFTSSPKGLDKPPYSLP
ncbi:type I methionyl aminopeptidase [uncultured Maricaulis sp.]|uniref:type I methionyl aminopeptidase n=1 Tax=uncultured Maricaulis sp. TaxID=174710 RepID=UPI0030D998EC